MSRRRRSTTSASNSHRLAALAAVLRFSTSPSNVGAFSTLRHFGPIRREPIERLRGRRHTPPPARRLSTPWLSRIIDAEVVLDDGTNGRGGDGVPDAPTPPPMSLVEYSQSQDPDWKSMPVAFVDAPSNTYIDCSLAFYVRDPSSGGGVGGEEYALGVPCEVPVVVALELEEGGGEGGEGAAVVELSRVVPINPDGSGFVKGESKEEVFQIAACALTKEFGPAIRLKKTPRVLTIEGDLDGVLGDWRDLLLGGAAGKGRKGSEMSFEEALNVYDEEEKDDEEDFFDKIMRRDLGPDYMSLVDDDDDINEELLKLFDVDGLDGDLERLVEDIDSEGSKVKDDSYNQLVQGLPPSAALKLVNFLGPGGKEYTVLRPLRPVLLVGREDPHDYTKRVLLTRGEQEEILPRLERSCRESLEEAGFFLAGSGE